MDRFCDPQEVVSVSGGTVGVTFLEGFGIEHMGVEPKIGGFDPPKWMLYFMVQNPIKVHDLGGFYHYFWKHPI